MTKDEKELGVPPLSIQGGIFIGLSLLLFAFLLTTFLFSINDQLQTGAVVRAFHNSVAFQQNSTDPASPYQAIQLAQFAYHQQDPKSIDFTRNLYQLYGQHYFPNPNAGIGYTSAAHQKTDQALFPGICFSLLPNGEVSALNYYAPQDTALRLYTVNNSVLKYRPNPHSARELSLDLKPFLRDAKEFEVGLSADKKNLQLLSLKHQASLYTLNGQVFPAPRLQLFQPEPQAQGQTEAPTDTLELNLGFYDFFSKTFVDPTGHSYTLEEVVPFLTKILPTVRDGYRLPYNNVSKQSIQLDSLFSFDLIDKKGLLDLKLLARMRAQPWWPSVQHPEISKFLGREDAPAVERIELSKKVYPAMMLWDLDSLQRPPTKITLDGPAPYYLTALTESTLVRVNPDGSIVILDPNTGPRQVLKNPGSAILEFLISPDQRHLAYRTASDSVFIWNLWGNLLHSYQQKNIARFFFSSDGSRLMTTSPDQVAAWTAQTHSFQIYARPANAPPISFARFQDGDQHIVIGLATPPNAAKNHRGAILQEIPYWGQQQEDGQESQLVYWEPEGQTIVFANLPTGSILDATVSAGGEYAIILQSTAATLISDPKSNSGFNPLQLFQSHRKTIRAEEQAGQRGKLSLSPAGNYLVRQSADKRRVELFDRSGQPFNAFDFPYGFQAGFQGNLFTSDDYFMMARQADELWFWHPENAQSGMLRQWTRQFELSRREKQKYGLNTLADYIPGKQMEAKVWALPTLLIAFLFLLFYFSDFIMEFLHKKSYLEFSLYLCDFLLLLAILVALWGIGLQVPEINGIAFYGVIWTTLFLVSVWVFRNYAQYRLIPLVMAYLTGLSLVVGSIAFFLQEKAGLEVLYGLLPLVLFIGLIDQPVYLALTAYKDGNRALFSRRLLLPAAGLSLVFWAVAGWFTGDLELSNIRYLLNFVAGISLALILIVQSWEQIRAQKYLAFAAYAVPAVLISLYLWNEQVLFPPAIAASFFLGWRYGQKLKYKYSFWYYASCLLVVIGAIIGAIVTDTPIFWASRLGLSLLFVVLLFALSQKVSSSSSRQTGPLGAALRGVTIIGIWILGYAFTVAANILAPKEPVNVAVVAETANRSENNRQATIKVAGETTTTSEALVLAEAENTIAIPPTIPPVAEAAPRSVAIPLPPVTPTNDRPSPRADVPPLRNPIPSTSPQVVPPDTSKVRSFPNPSSQTERRQLIEQLFHRNEGVRRDALNQLAASHKEALALIDELIQTTYRHPGMMYGLEKVLTLLEMLPDQQLRAKSLLLDAFFKDVYSPLTANTIKGLRARIGK